METTMTLKRIDRLSELDLAVLPAIFARSNMGQGLPKQDVVDRMKLPGSHGQPIELHTAVIWVCEEFMESDEHEHMFVKEAKWWVPQLRRRGKTDICRVHTDIAELYWGADDPIVKQFPARRRKIRA
jgi:hypothetical protein